MFPCTLVLAVVTVHSGVVLLGAAAPSCVSSSLYAGHFSGFGFCPTPQCIWTADASSPRGPSCHTEAPAGVPSGPCPFHCGRSCSGLLRKTSVVWSAGSAPHGVELFPAPGLSSAFQSVRQSPLQTPTGGPGLALSPRASALLCHSPVLKTWAPVGHRRVSARATRKPSFGAACPLTDPRPSPRVLWPIFAGLQRSPFLGWPLAVGLDSGRDRWGWGSHHEGPAGVEFALSVLLQSHDPKVTFFLSSS